MSRSRDPNIPVHLRRRPGTRHAAALSAGREVLVLARPGGVRARGVVPPAGRRMGGPLAGFAGSEARIEYSVLDFAS